MIFRKSATLQDVTPIDAEQGSMGLAGNGVDTISMSPSISKKVQLVGHSVDAIEIRNYRIKPWKI